MKHKSEDKAGRQLDRRVAEAVFGLTVEFRDNEYRAGYYYRYSESQTIQSISGPAYDPGIAYVPHYSTDIAAAWEVVEKLGLPFQCEGNMQGWFTPELRHRFRFSKPSWLPFSESDTVPHAICLAALKAVKP